MFISVVEWALRVMIASAILLLWSILLAFLWNVVIVTVLHGPAVAFNEMIIFVAIVAIAVGYWGFSVVRGRTVP